MEKVAIGIVGLGEIAQIVYLPILSSLNDKYEIRGLCDISPSLLKAMGSMYDVKRLYADMEDLARQEDIDAVFVLNNDVYHTDSVICALKNGKHVFVEKPLCLTLSEADRIIQAEKCSGKKVLVGYMRTYAPAYRQAKMEIEKLDRINYIRMRDIIGYNYFFTGASKVIRFDDIPEATVRERKARLEKLLAEAVGNAPGALKNAYGIMCGLSSHDISSLRGIAGMPKRVIGASYWNDGLFMNAIFEYESFNAFLETGIDGIKRFDAHIEVYGASRSVKVKYDTAYIRQLPVILTIGETSGEAYIESHSIPTYKDPFTCEIEYFYDMVTRGIASGTTVQDARKDLEIFRMMLEAMKRGAG